MSTTICPCRTATRIHGGLLIRMCRAAIGFRQHFKSVPQEFTEQAGRLEQTGQLGELGQNPGGSTGAFIIFMWHCGSMNRRNGRCLGIQIIWNMEEKGVERNTSQINGQLEGDGRVFFEFDEFAGGILFRGLLPTFKSLVYRMYCVQHVFKMFLFLAGVWSLLPSLTCVCHILSCYIYLFCSWMVADMAIFNAKPILLGGLIRRMQALTQIASWPSKGKLVFENVQLKYRPHLPLVPRLLWALRW